MHNFIRNLRRSKYWLLIGLLISLFSLISCSSTDTPGLAIGDVAPEFSALTAQGETISLTDYKGNQPVLLFFHMAVG